MEIKANIEMFRDYQSRPLNHWIALSEYIDNSISSYKKNNLNSVNGLIIDITFDYTDENNHKLIILDNSSGMDSFELECSIQPHDIKGKSDTTYNQHGVGMKAATFWYGEDLTIYSKRKDEDEYKLELITSNKLPNDFVYVESLLSSENKIINESGTMIIVNHVYDKRSILTKIKQLEEIENAIGWRYNKIINQGAVIKLNICSKDNKKNKAINIKSFSNTPLTKEMLLNSDKKNIKEMKENRFNSLWSDYYKKIHQKNKDYLFDLWKKLENNEPLETSIKIILNNKECLLKFGILNDNVTRKNYCGLTIYHLDRAIIHGPNFENSKNSCYYFAESKITSTIKASWLYGEIDLTGIEKPTQNKEEFDWSYDGKENLKNILYEIYENLNTTILDFIINISQIKSDNKNNIESQKDTIPKTFINAHDVNIKTGENNIEFLNFKININDKDVEIDILESGKEFLEFNYDDMNNKLTLIIDPENKFWQPFLHVSNFKEKIVNSTIIVLGLAAWKIEKMINEDNDCKNIDLIEIIKEIIAKEII